MSSSKWQLSDSLNPDDVPLETHKILFQGRAFKSIVCVNFVQCARENIFFRGKKQEECKKDVPEIKNYVQ